jgi:hypothetical protein
LEQITRAARRVAYRACQTTESGENRFFSVTGSHFSALIVQRGAVGSVLKAAGENDQRGQQNLVPRVGGRRRFVDFHEIPLFPGGHFAADEFNDPAGNREPVELGPAADAEMLAEAVFDVMAAPCQLIAGCMHGPAHAAGAVVRHVGHAEHSRRRNHRGGAAGNADGRAG